MGKRHQRFWTRSRVNTVGVGVLLSFAMGIPMWAMDNAEHSLGYYMFVTGAGGLLFGGFAAAPACVCWMIGYGARKLWLFLR